MFALFHFVGSLLFISFKEILESRIRTFTFFICMLRFMNHLGDALRCGLCY